MAQVRFLYILGDIKNSGKGKSYCNKHEYMVQLFPALETAWTFRILLDIPSGVGRISNGDQSMHYKYNESRKSYQMKL